MLNWTGNTIMTWNGTKVSDHGRTALQQSNERVSIDKRMANGTMRRQFVANKRTWTCTWEGLPSTNSVTTFKTADGGMSGEQMEAFYDANPGKFKVVFRRGSASGKVIPNPSDTALPYQDPDFYIVNVMITDFSKEIRKRGSVDLWNITITLEEV